MDGPFAVGTRLGKRRGRARGPEPRGVLDVVGRLKGCGVVGGGGGLSYLTARSARASTPRSATRSTNSFLDGVGGVA